MPATMSPMLQEKLFTFILASTPDSMNPNRRHPISQKGSLLKGAELCKQHRLELVRSTIAQEDGWLLPCGWETRISSRLESTILPKLSNLLLGSQRSEGDVDTSGHGSVLFRETSYYWAEVLQMIKDYGLNKAFGIGASMVSFRKFQTG